MRILILFLLLLLFTGLVAGTAYLTCFTVNENEYVILTQFGKTVEMLDEPGLYFKKPGFMQTVNRLDKRLHIFKTQPITLLLHDKNPIIFACFICWKISEPELFFQRVRDVDIASQKIGDMINSQLGSVLGAYDLGNIINVEADQVKLTEIENLVLSNTEVKAASEYGIHLNQVGIRRLAYPNIVERSVYSRMRAEREKEAKKYRAEGREEAYKIEAQTDLEVKKLMAEAYKESQVLKGKGDQEAMRIYADAHGKDMEFYEFLKSLEIYQQTLQENTTLVLSTGSELFKYLNYHDGEKTVEEGDHDSR